MSSLANVASTAASRVCHLPMSDVHRNANVYLLMSPATAFIALRQIFFTFVDSRRKTAHFRSEPESKLGPLCIEKHYFV